MTQLIKKSVSIRNWSFLVLIAALAPMAVVYADDPCDIAPTSYHITWAGCNETCDEREAACNRKCSMGLASFYCPYEGDAKPTSGYCDCIIPE